MLCSACRKNVGAIALLEMLCTVRRAFRGLRVATAPSSPNHQRKVGQPSQLPADAKIEHLIFLGRRGIKLKFLGHTDIEH